MAFTVQGGLPTEVGTKGKKNYFQIIVSAVGMIPKVIFRVLDFQNGREIDLEVMARLVDVVEDNNNRWVERMEGASECYSMCQHCADYWRRCLQDYFRCEKS